MPTKQQLTDALELAEMDAQAARDELDQLRRAVPDRVMRIARRYGMEKIMRAMLVRLDLSDQIQDSFEVQCRRATGRTWSRLDVHANIQSARRAAKDGLKGNSGRYVFHYRIVRIDGPTAHRGVVENFRAT